MIVTSQFRPAWWLRGPHRQTLWPLLQPGNRHLRTRREQLELPDGDCLSLDWLERPGAPIVCVFHGLEGSVHSHYAARILDALHAHGWQVVLMHFRGCDGRANRLARSYHSGDTGDIGFLLATLGSRYPGQVLAAVGYSLGGNALLKYLGEQGAAAPLATAVAVSVPLRLDLCAERMQHGFSRVYQRYLVRQLQDSVKRKAALVEAQGISLEHLSELNTFWTFDDQVTAPLHGFDGVHDYYARSSSRQYLHAIRTPTLIVQARDDPFMSAGVLPDESELSGQVTLEIAEHGGHVGFVAGSVPGRGRYWIDGRIVEHLDSYRTAVVLA